MTPVLINATWLCTKNTCLKKFVISIFRKMCKIITLVCSIVSYARMETVIKLYLVLNAWFPKHGSRRQYCHQSSGGPVLEPVFGTGTYNWQSVNQYRHFCHAKMCCSDRICLYNSVYHIKHSSSSSYRLPRSVLVQR